MESNSVTFLTPSLNLGLFGILHLAFSVLQNSPAVPEDPEDFHKVWV